MGLLDELRYDPLPVLEAASLVSLRCAVARVVAPDAAGVDDSQGLAVEVEAVTRRQRPDGRWCHRGARAGVRPVDDYDQLETFRQLAVLVHQFGLDRNHAAVANAAAFLGRFQTGAGDFRGIYGGQYTPNYTGVITEVLVVAGYHEEPVVERALSWLADMRQDDGGWAIPTRTLGLPLSVMGTSADVLEPDRSQPSAHLVTGMALRAFAAHPRYRHAVEAGQAGRWLKGQLFRRDNYPDHRAASYWTVLSYPFWWTDLLSALDTLTTLGFPSDDPDVADGLRWFLDHQEPSGLWNSGHNRPKGPHTDLWVAYAVYRLLHRVS